MTLLQTSKRRTRVVAQCLVGCFAVSAIAPYSSAFAQVPEPIIEAATPTRVPSRSDEAYTLGAGDRIRIEVFKVAQYSGENQVLVDGTVNLPEAGNVSVQGLTLKEAADVISARYAKLLKYPIVTVSLVTPRPLRVGVAGEVNRPGSYTLSTTEGASQLPTLTRALQQAGGVTQMANIREVEVRRARRGGTEEVIKVNLWAFLQAGDLSQDITLRSGDSIFIPTAPTVDLRESVQLSAASFAADRSQPLNIAIVGEVYRPGPYTVTSSADTGAAGDTGQTGGGAERPPTITRAIQVAGGVKPQADIRRIQVRRQTRAGLEQVIDIDLWKLLSEGDLKQDLILQDRDTVIIPEAKAVDTAEATQLATASFSPDSIRVNVAGEVKQPGVVRVPPNTPLNQVLLAAGGFNTRARQRSVELLRLNPDGTVTRREISIDFSKGINEQTNPALRNDDIVVVKRSGLTAFSDSLGTVVNPISSFLSIFSLFTIFRSF
ncbi:MAG TPA: SLBB domain-containing protein [Leptolyngbyaceae cyanobacterium M33_DOE_097]|uniref:Sugar ABC transporter substrate-binding protein n=1 Tax=Oscillatoriales cyanobacterium SpSt-418 TaxID=2282169 RepID=A0A7C3KCG9_9CYAN|nr:SLBB domain-containing protein [Leptolyngbyaceae cyanobacterium M33_DOE_097]